MLCDGWLCCLWVCDALCCETGGENFYGNENLFVRKFYKVNRLTWEFISIQKGRSLRTRLSNDHEKNKGRDLGDRVKSPKIGACRGALDDWERESAQAVAEALFSTSGGL